MSAITAVNRPTNIQARDANIEQKLQLYGIFTAFKQGKVPSNEQIDVALNSFLESKAIKTPSNRLSDEGRDLVADTREVVRLAKYLFLSKNEDNLLQDFIWQTEQFDPKQVSAPGTPVDKKTAQQQGNEALEGMRTLGTLLITNGQFRKLLKDFTIIFRDVAGDAATNVAGRVRPSEDELGQIDRPADDNTWHEKPKFSKDDLRQRVKGAYGGNLKQDAQETADAAKASAQTGSGKRTDVNARGGASAARGTLKQKFDANVSDETKEKIKQRNKEYQNRAKEYYNKKMPQERREQTVWRLKKMILECQQHPDYTRAVQTLLDLAEQYGRHGRSFAQGSSGTVKQTRTNLQKAQDDLKILIERYANGTSTEPLWSSIDRLYQAARTDEELRNWFSSMNHYIRRCLLEQGYILDDASNRDWNQLYDHGRYLLRDKHRGDTNLIMNESRFILDQFDKDPQNKEFGQAVQRLFTHLGNDENGKPVFKRHLVKDLTEVIIPALVENIQYIPVPRIEYMDPQFDIVIENLIVEADNLFPNVVEIQSDHYFKMGRKKIPNNQSQQFDVRFAGVQMDLRNVSYYISRKKGFPSITDTGMANISLAGSGLSFELKVSTANKTDKQRFFKVDKVDVDIRNLKVKLLESRHKTLFNLVEPLLLKIMRPVILKVVESVIKKQFNSLDGAMYEIKQEADRALEESKSQVRSADDKEKPKVASNMYSRYYTSTKAYMDRKKEEKKKQAELKASDKKVNMAYTMHDSIFPNIKLPGATSERATKYKDMAGQGDKWQSPVFAIGQAGRSGDIPRAPRIEEKPDQRRMFEESRRAAVQPQQGQGMQQQQPAMYSYPQDPAYQRGLGGHDQQAVQNQKYQQHQQQHQQQPGMGMMNQPHHVTEVYPQGGNGADYGMQPKSNVIGQPPMGNGNGGMGMNKLGADGGVGMNKLGADGGMGMNVPGAYGGSTGQQVASGVPATGLNQDPSTLRM